MRPHGESDDRTARTLARLRVELAKEIDELSQAKEAAQDRLNALASTMDLLEESTRSAELQSAQLPFEPRPQNSKLIPVRKKGTALRDLPIIYQRIMRTLSRASEPLRARRISELIGSGTDKKQIENVRSKLNLLVARGWLKVEAQGLFAPTA